LAGFLTLFSYNPPVLDAEQTELARSRLQALEQEIVVEYNPGPHAEDPFARAMGEVLNELATLAAPNLRVSQARGADRPSFKVQNVTYLAVPLEREFEPFLDLLVLLSTRIRPPTTVEAARIELLIAPTCPNCPRVVAACGQVAATSPQVELVVIDVQHFSDLAGSCRSVPTVIIDGTRTVVGPLTSAELTEILAERGQPGYLTRALGSMIEAGRLAEMVPLLTTEEGHAALATLMRVGSMQQKMGLMLAVEQAIEHDQHALDGALPELLPLLESDDVTVRGDAADLLGKIGAPGARADLTALLEDENADVREVAAESLELLRDPS
jgi:hypothetical protein